MRTVKALRRLKPENDDQRTGVEIQKQHAGPCVRGGASEHDTTQDDAVARAIVMTEPIDDTIVSNGRLAREGALPGAPPVGAWLEISIDELATGAASRDRGQSTAP